MITFDKLSNIAAFSFMNGYRLHLDSLRLLCTKSYATATMLSVLAMEEFGKYFSLSTYVFYTKTNDTRDATFEDEFLRELYSHPFKQRACFGRDGFIPSQKLYAHATNRKFEELKQKSLYVGLKRRKGKIQYSAPIYNPLRITRATAARQVLFLNKLLLNMATQRVKGILEMDEESVNKLLSKKMITLL